VWCSFHTLGYECKYCITSKRYLLLAFPSGRGPTLRSWVTIFSQFNSLKSSFTFYANELASSFFWYPGFTRSKTITTGTFRNVNKIILKIWSLSTAIYANRLCKLLKRTGHRTYEPGCKKLDSTIMKLPFDEKSFCLRKFSKSVFYWTGLRTMVARFSLVQTYQNGKNIPNNHKLYQTATHYARWP
jgi:hypothetical protein